MTGKAVKTSLGPTIEHHGATLVLDLTDLPIFHGLSVLSRALGELVIEQAKSDRIDINFERGIRASENPELQEHLGVRLVKITGEHRTVSRLVRDPEAFQENMRALFGTLQRHRYRNLLFVGEGKASTALVFDFVFPDPSTPRRATFILERVPSSKNEAECYLRITIEDPDRRRLDLNAIAHKVVEDLESRTFIAGSTRIAHTWSEGLRREAERNRRAFSEAKKPYSHLFRQFAKAGLDAIENVNITWNDAFVDRILESDHAELNHVLKRVLLALEDGAIRHLLDDGEVIRVVSDDVAVYVDRSQLGRVLNLSLGGRRERFDIEVFLDRMPVTAKVAAGSSDAPLAGVKVFLIHHITAEVLGVIAALRRLGCRDLTTLFVAYAGEAPSGYLEPLLELPADEFRCLALVNVPDDESVEGHYKLSSQYSVLENGATLAATLGRKRMRFFEAMRATAASQFMSQVRRAEAAGERCLIVEDGGYLAPLLNQACHDGQTVAALLAEVDPGCDDDRPLKEVLAPRLIGSVEHTRNGMDRLQRVEEECGGLVFPAFTIAVSEHKTSVEAREVGVSVLNAVENVLHATGQVLSRRRCLVLGSRGAIGGQAVKTLTDRLNQPEAQLAGVDLKVGSEEAPFTITEADSFADLPLDVRRGMDLVVGVTGASVLAGPDLEDWLLAGERRQLILASGSTKTEEFTDLAEWLDRLLAEDTPQLAGRPVHIDVQEVKDQITGRLYAHRYVFDMDRDGGKRRREVVFLANMTPVNFMFYGVPTEVIDEVLAELLGCALGLLRRAEKEGLPLTIQAVDRDITPAGEPLAKRPIGAKTT